MKNLLVVLMFSSAFLTGLPASANSTVDQLLQTYQQQGAQTVDPEQGKKLWYSKSGDRSCTTCHNSSPDKMGKHARTGKLIKPMASSANPERFQDSKKVEKWFLRNCKWTLGCLCTVQEKANTLSWLNSF